MKKSYKSSVLLAGVIILSLIGSMIFTTPARAQGTTTLSIVYPVAEICAGGQMTINVRVDAVTSLYAYDVVLYFDPTEVTVLSLANGGFLTASPPNRNIIDNTNGMVRYAMTQIGGTAKNGAGNLITLTVQAKKDAAEINFSINTIEDYDNGFYPTILMQAPLGNRIPFTITPTVGPEAHECNVHFPAGIRISACDAQTVIPVYLDDVVDLWGYSVRLSYNPAVIQVLSIDNGTIFSPYYQFPIIPTFNETSGLIEFSNTILDSTATPINGSGLLMTLTVKPLSENVVSGLTITGVDLSNRNGRRIPVTISSQEIYTYGCNPNAVDITDFNVLRKSKKAILSWETANEIDIQGFNIYRSGKSDGTLKKVNAELIPAEAVGSSSGATYQITNSSLKPWKTYFYWLEWVDMDSNSTLYGPIKAKPPK